MYSQRGICGLTMNQLAHTRGPEHERIASVKGDRIGSETPTLPEHQYHD